MERLQELGLSKTEASVYLALQQTGEATAGKISKTSGVHIRSVYDALETLMQKGLVTRIEIDDVHVYSSAGLGAFFALLDEQKKILEELEQSLPKTNRTAEPIVRVFRGTNGCRALLEQKLREKKTVFYYGANASLWIRYPLIMEKWNHERKKRGFEVKAIAINKSELVSILTKAGWTVKTVSDLFITPWWKFGDCVVFPIWELPNPIFIQIQNQNTARTHEHIFHELWKNAKKIK